MALTAAQRADVRFFCGWSARFRQTDTRLEQALNALDMDAETLALFTNAIGGTPPGLIALARNELDQLQLAMKRRKAAKVGSIELNPRELEDIRDLGRQYTAQMCSILGVPRRNDVFSASGPTVFADYGGSGYGGGNYVGK